MTYEFDKIIDRRHSNALKWDVAEHELPMWVADMDFQTAPEVRAAIIKRADHGIFGYSILSDDWYQAYITWWHKRHHFLIEEDWLIFATGVVPTISSVVRKLTTPGEKILIQTPVYNIFFNSILNNGRVVVENRLAYDGEDYQIDFEDLENKLADPQTTLMILCNPHNPVGKIYSKEELKRIGELCFKHHVIVLADEIHCDLTDPGDEYVPFASVSETCRDNSITCLSPTKAFNLAGLQTSAVVVSNPTIRHKVWRGLNTDEVAEPNAFAVTATVAAFTQGGDWLDALRAYIAGNKKFVAEYIANEIPHVQFVSSQATYLTWLNCQALNGTTDEVVSFIREQTGLHLSKGSQFGGDGSTYIRMNVACPRSVLEDGLQRLKAGIEAYQTFEVRK